MPRVSPQPDGTIDHCHDADITAETIIPPWYGKHLDLDYAIYTCFANAEYHARQREKAGQRDQAGQPDQQPAAATMPQEVPWTPTATEVDIFAAIRQQCRGYASSGHR